MHRVVEKIKMISPSILPSSYPFLRSNLIASEQCLMDLGHAETTAGLARMSIAA